MKSYNDIAKDIFQRRDQYFTEQRKKRKTAVYLSLSFCSVLLVAVLGVGIWQSVLPGDSPLTGSEPSHSEDSSAGTEQSSGSTPIDINSAGDTPHSKYPYLDHLQYTEKKIPIVAVGQNVFSYDQIREVNKTSISLYATLYDKSLHRDCIPVFDRQGNPSFSRIPEESDPDTKRFEDMKAYLGAQSGLFYALASLPQSSYRGVRCALLRNSGKEGNVAVCAEIDVYTNSSLSVIVSKDFSAVEETVSPHIAQMRTLLASEGASAINGKRCALRYIYQTRTHQEKGLEEERYIYYAFFEKEGMEYLVQFTSNYTLPNTNQSALGNGYSLKTQQECRDAFESILADVLMK